MSLDIHIHVAQTAILRELLFHPSATFAELQKPTGLTSDHFNFHIARLVELGMVKRIKKGTYTLTIKGKEYANRLDTERNTIERQPKIAVLLVIEQRDGRILQQERLKQPYYGYWGFPTGKISWSERTIDTAARELMEETGLTADLRVSGMFHKLDYDKDTKELLEDKYFFIVYGSNPQGTLIEKMEGHNNAWLGTDQVHAKEKVFESIPETIALARRPDFEFVEKAYFYDIDNY